MKDRKDLLQCYEAPFFPFPENPKLVMISGMPVYEYIPPAEFVKQLKDFASRLDLRQFDHVFYNLNGGKIPAEMLAGLKVKGYERGYTPIEYHMAKDGQPV